MKRPIVSLFICFLAVSSGCASFQDRRVAVPAKPEISETLSQRIDLIDEKVRFLTKKLENKDLSEKDKEIASKLLDAYRSLSEASQRSSWISSGYLTEAEYSELIDAIFHGLSLLEADYFFEEQGRDFSRPMGLFANKRREILDAYLSGDFKGVIDHCLELERVFGADALTPEIAALFALSLAKEGMLEDAIAIGEGITREFEVSPDLTLLRARIAEWKLKLGRREDALLVYERLTDTLDEQKAIVQSVSRKITATSIGDQEVEGTVNQLLQKVEQLVHERKFDEAKDLLVRKKTEVLHAPDREAIDQALKNLEITQEIYFEEKLSRISWRKGILETARKQMEEEKFEEAISNLEVLEAEQEDVREILQLKEQTIEGLVNRERNRAAKIYLEAKKSWDPAKKEKLLRTSYEILKVLIDKYPSSILNEKLKSHLKTVGDELNKLGVTDM